MTVMDAVKLVGDNTIEGLAIPYGRDLDGEAFTKDTDLALDWYDSRPLLMQHGQSPTFGLQRVGRVTKVEARDDGLWAEAIIEASDRYKGRLRQLVADGHLAFSSGSSSNYTRKATDGTIHAWPFVELSLVPNPANPNAVAAVKELGGDIADGAPAKEVSGHASVELTGRVGADDVARIVDNLLTKRDEARDLARMEAKRETEYRAAMAGAIVTLAEVDYDPD